MRIGVLGGGQLGRMLGLAGIPLGLEFRFLDPSPEAPAAAVGDLLVGAYDDPVLIAELARWADIVTWEFENVPARALRDFPLRPPLEALSRSQDRAGEKALFADLGIPSARETDHPPAVVKTRRLGYDGKGQRVALTQAELDAAFADLGSDTIVEDIIRFDRELSLLAVRGLDGDVAFYPLVENLHRDGILRLSIAPAPELDPRLQKLAEDYGSRLLQHLNYVGVLALELFEVGGALLANELAPRVHNSGHWTIEGAETSQFENHLRAIAGLPLGSTAVRETSAMLNLIGELPHPAAVLSEAGAHLHLYGKEPRPRRKLGHVTLIRPAPDRIRALRRTCTDSPP